MDYAELVEVVQKAIENMPYLDLTDWVAGDDDDDEHPITLREFYEGTWQGSHADELFPAVAKVAVGAMLVAQAKP